MRAWDSRPDELSPPRDIRAERTSEARGGGRDVAKLCTTPTFARPSGRSRGPAGGEGERGGRHGGVTDVMGSCDAACVDGQRRLRCVPMPSPCGGASGVSVGFRERTVQRLPLLLLRRDVEDALHDVHGGLPRPGRERPGVPLLRGAGVRAEEGRGIVKTERSKGGERSQSRQRGTTSPLPIDTPMRVARLTQGAHAR